MSLLSCAAVVGAPGGAEPGVADGVATRPRLVVVGLRHAHWWPAFDDSAFDGLDVHRVATASVGGESLDARLVASRQLVVQHGGAAVLWVEEGMDAYHIWVVRSFEADLYRTAVPIERMARARSLLRLEQRLSSIAEALQAAEPLPMKRVDLEPDREPTVTPLHAWTAKDTEADPPPESAPVESSTTTERGTLRVAAAYAGTTLARSPAWQSGLAVAAGWVTRPGAMVELGYTAYQRVAVPLPGRALELVRHPVHVALGYELELDRWLLGIDGSFIVDVTERMDWQSSGGRLRGEHRVSAGVALAPRGRVGFSATDRIELFTMLSAELWLRTVEYRVSHESGAAQVVFASRRARATPTAGVALRL